MCVSVQCACVILLEKPTSLSDHKTCQKNLFYLLLWECPSVCPPVRNAEGPLTIADSNMLMESQAVSLLSQTVIENRMHVVPIFVKMLPPINIISSSRILWHRRGREVSWFSQKRSPTAHITPHVAYQLSRGAKHDRLAPDAPPHAVIELNLKFRSVLKLLNGFHEL